MKSPFLILAAAAAVSFASVATLPADAQRGPGPTATNHVMR